MKQIEPVYRTIGAIVRSKRRQLEWTQAKLAQHLRVSRATLANIETGRQRILAHQLYVFAAVLGARPEDFLPPSSVNSLPSRARVPIPENLKPEQREQILQLIEAATGSASSAERTHGKT